jgi:hypothetical protein
MIRDFFDSDFLQEGILLTGKEPNRQGSPSTTEWDGPRNLVRFF